MHRGNVMGKIFAEDPGKPFKVRVEQGRADIRFTGVHLLILPSSRVHLWGQTQNRGPWQHGHIQNSIKASQYPPRLTLGQVLMQVQIHT